MILFCRITLLTCGNGCSIPFMAILWKGLINFLHRWMSLLLRVYLIVYGINMFRLRFLYLLGVFFATVCRQRIILWGTVSFNITLPNVLAGAVGKTQLAIYFYIVQYLAICEFLCRSGYMYLLSLQRSSVIIFFSLVI
jgi:hypothetical protein